MSTDIDRNKHPFKIIFLLAAIFILCVFLFFTRPEDLISISYVKDFESSIHLWCCFGLNVVTLTSIFRLLFAFGTEQRLTNKRTNILLQCYYHVKNDTCLSLVIVANVVLDTFILVLAFMKLQPNESTAFWRQVLSYTLTILCFSAFLACVYMLFDYDDADLAFSQDLETSIGALWAFGAYKAFYEIVLSGITKRMRTFEMENNLRFLVQKLVIICPLSCNATGSLEDRYAEITKIGHLEPIIVDEGANLSRTLKSTVYCIHGQSTNQQKIENKSSLIQAMDDAEKALNLSREDVYIAAELPSPLATLWEARESMNDTIRKYHRDCFIKTLKKLVRQFPCIILEYDDQDPDKSEPLHRFLLSRLNNHLLC